MYFCLNTDSIPKISYMNRNITPANWIHFEQTPEEYHLLMINEGIMYIKENECCFELKEGDILLLQPGMTHVGYRESACDYYYINFSSETFTSFDCSEFDSIENILLENKRLFYNCNPFNYELYEHSKLFIPKDLHLTDSTLLYQLRHLMDEAIQAFNQKNAHYKLICSCKLMEILSALSTYFSDSIFHKNAENSSMVSQARKVQEVMDILQAQYAKKLTGLAISEQMSMNFDYLNRIFKKQTGCTIFEYLNMIRVNQAKELILAGTMKSYEIATAVGFCDEYHFSKSFKKIVGVPPSHYLQKI
ncbi:MAG TPA: AraC family transcriptional regulator [Lachnospiraceae bacterium]|nr:AraC family transcriptional regulator [Lachnospiraceae bacterium]